jgi:hypothetical protein
VAVAIVGEMCVCVCVCVCVLVCDVVVAAAADVVRLREGMT